MRPKLSKADRERVIARVLAGHSVSKVSKEAGISRTVIYRWIKRFEDQISFHNLAAPASHVQYLQKAVRPLKGKTPKRSHFSIQTRIGAIEEVLSKKRPVAAVCREFKVSRAIFYRWIKRYAVSGGMYSSSKLEARVEKLPQRLPKKFSTHFVRSNNKTDSFNEHAALEALKDKKPQIDRYPRQTSTEYEQLILNAVSEYPELGAAQLVQILPQIGQKPVVGLHGVQNVLRRNDLNTYSKRLEFTQKQQPPVPIRASFHGILAFFKKLAALPANARSRKIAFWTSFSVPVILSVFLLGFTAYIRMYLEAPSFGVGIGYFFSSFALLFGFFFFLYSFKYYISVALVLAFSRHSLAKNEGSIIAKEGMSNRSGLTPDVSAVILERRPFVSIHLPLYNEKRVVNRLLEAVTTLDYDNYEVIVCDDSTDETKDIVAEWKNHPKIKISHRETRDGFKGAALREAARLIDPKSEFVLVFDADFIPFADTITQFLKYFQVAAGTLDFRQGSRVQGLGSSSDQNSKTLNPKPYALNPNPVAVVQGYQWHVLNKSENWITRGVRTEYAGSYIVERSAAEIYGGLKQIAGSVYIARRDALDSIGWGDSITEDFEMTLKLYEKGMRIVYTPYIQTPSECVSTIKRLIRQRMRWAEGHSFNIKKHFVPLLFSSKLTFFEKLEVLYLSPYYLQSFFFILGTFCWFLGEAVFRTRLPFWTEVWGWSMVLSNMLSLPLMNLVGLFLEEGEEKDYLGILSFLALTYTIAPFQAYASVKGFLEKEEGPWFRTPKTGHITDVFRRGRFYRWLSGIFPSSAGASEGKPVGQPASVSVASSQRFPIGHLSNLGYLQNVALVPPPRSRRRFTGNVVLALALIVTFFLNSLAPLVSVSQQVHASETAFRSLASAQKTPQVPVSVKITEPEIIRYELEEGKTLEYIFHPEPRVRVKLVEKEVDMRFIGVESMGSLNRHTAYKEGNIYTYKNVYQDIDLRYMLAGAKLQEELVLRQYHPLESIDEEVTLTGLVMAKIGDQIAIADIGGGNPIMTFTKPFMYEVGQPEIISEGLEYEIEKTTFGYIVKKVLTTEGKQWLADPARQYPVAIDPTMVQSSPITASVTAAETDQGSYQRKIVYSDNASAWYAFEADGGNVAYEKCLASAGCESNSDWAAPVSVSADAASQGIPSVWFQRAGTGDGMIFVAWIDDSTTTQATADSLAFETINTASSDAQGGQCNSADQGSIVITNRYAYIAVGNNGDVLVGYGIYTGTDTEANIFEVPTGGCTYTSRETSSGLPVGSTAFTVIPMEVAANRIQLIYWDNGGNNDIRQSQFDISSSTWNYSDNDVDSTANLDVGTLSAVTDGTDVWVLVAASATAVDFFRCSACTGDSAPTWTTTDATPFTSLANLIEVSLSYVATSPSNQLIALALKDTTNTQVYFSSTDADTISWSSSDTSLNFTAGTNANLSSTFYVANDTEVGAMILEGAAFSFSTLPENLWVLFLIAPLLPLFIGRLRRLQSVEALSARRGTVYVRS